MKKIIALSLLSLATLSSQAFAHDKFTIGRTVLLEGKNTHAIVRPAICRMANEIQIKAERDTFITKAVVEFNNGEQRTFQFQRKFDKNERSDWRKFSYQRCVKNIQLYGRAERDSAGIEVFGRK